MAIKRTLGERIFGVANATFMILLMITCLYPIYFVIMASFSDSNLLLAHRGLLLKPLGFNVEAYNKIWENKFILSGFMNTMFILVVGSAINVVMTLLGGYFLSRKDVKLKPIVVIMILVTMYFGGGLIPTYLLVKSLGLDDTLWALILPGAMSTYNTIVMRTAFTSVPDELEEAARIDGAGHLTILFRVYVPLIKATTAVILLYYAVAHWNAWFGASIYLRTRSLFPVQLVLREILIQNTTESMTTGVAVDDVASVAESIKYALIVATTVPILCIYPFLQRFFEKGVMVGSVKG